MDEPDKVCDLHQHHPLHIRTATARPNHAEATQMEGRRGCTFGTKNSRMTRSSANVSPLMRSLKNLTGGTLRFKAPRSLAFHAHAAWPALSQMQHSAHTFLMQRVQRVQLQNVLCGNSSRLHVKHFPAAERTAKVACSLECSCRQADGCHGAYLMGSWYASSA
jgi:hypothetical protein